MRNSFKNLLFLLSAIVVTLNMADAQLAAPKGSAKFAVDLYTNCVKEKGGNVIISPMSVETALSLTFMGSAGETTVAMAKGLELESPDKNALAERMSGLTASYKSGNPVSVANKVYVKTGFTIKKAFFDIASKSFNSESESIEFAKSEEAANTINTWVEGKTNQKIKDLIPKDVLNADTRMVLVNAIYFKGLWKNKFKTELTTKADFWVTPEEAKQVDMMSVKASFKYGLVPELDAAVLEMPYEGDHNLSMIVMLPNTKDGLANLETKLADISLTDVLKRLWKQEVTVKMPKFKVEYDIEMNKALTQMGMGVMFSDGADFSELLDPQEPLKVSKVIHKAFIEVNEEGTEAAAATAVMVMLMSAGPPRIRQFTVDRPFYYAIIDSATNNNLFAGRLVDV